MFGSLKVSINYGSYMTFKTTHIKTFYQLVKSINLIY